ncbi:MAG: ATP-NAD kinase family protein [Candidatus Aminicenantes bacterium]|nr:ATP-NAD kinase family protein [Candidatus Aminicenantes bacterium]
MIKVGLIVNPISGMGGSVGLKGTDGDAYKKAIELGAKPVVPRRVKDTLSLIKRKDIYFLVAKKQMGEDYVREFSFKYEVVGEIKEKTTAEDTKKIAKELISKEINLLVFAGGDGTARDIYDAIGTSVPVVAIPSGVKMFSSVFALSPYAAAKMIDSYPCEITDKEVLDIDEDAFRNNKLAAKLYGYLKVPKIESLLQQGKESSNLTVAERKRKREIAKYVAERMEKDTLYLLGPGTTLKSVADELKIEKTLLGIDAVYKGKMVGKDINEKELLNLLKKHKKAKIIVTPIGGNGFIFGRGSKQFTPQVLELVGEKNIIVVATQEKVSSLECLRVDTGDMKVDERLKGHIRVITGYKEEMIIEVK